MRKTERREIKDKYLKDLEKVRDQLQIRLAEVEKEIKAHVAVLKKRQERVFN